MKKRIIISGTLIILSIILVLSYSKIASDKFNNKNIRLGYCPTMSNLAQDIQSKNNQISLIPFDYTAQALSALNNAEIDVVLVGRIAEKTELNDSFEIKLRDGLTLVGKKKKMISINELQNMIVHTSESEEEAKKYIPETAEIVYHNSVEDAIEKGLDEAVLINWKYYSDNLELVIPIDENMNKIEKFRMPVLYTYDKKLLDNLEI